MSNSKTFNALERFIMQSTSKMATNDTDGEEDGPCKKQKNTKNADHGEELVVAGTSTKEKKKKEHNNTIDGKNEIMASFFLAQPLTTAHHGTAESGGGTETEMRPVARYGRIYKRKAPNYSKAEHGKILCPPGHRVCKHCMKALPLDQFYSNVKRYVCKFHHYQMVFKRTQERFAACEFERCAMLAWVELFYLCPILGYAKVQYDRHDIKDLLIQTKIPLNCAPRMVPINPQLPLRPNNIAIITQANLTLLVKIYIQSCSVGQYILFVQCCNLVPEKADVGVPWDPFHDPNFVRQEIDVLPILEKEKQMPKERPHVEAVYHRALEEERKLMEMRKKRNISEILEEEAAENKKNKV